MPIYEYQCKKCRHVCEVLQKAKDKPLEKCPKCGGPVVKLISSPAIQFKGNGWYITDYAKKTSAPPGAKAEAKPEAKSEPAAGSGKAKPDKSSS
jgi:putative FmdB family regulatory protein